MNIFAKIKNCFNREGLLGPARWMAAAAVATLHILGLVVVLNVAPMGVLVWVAPAFIVLPGIVTMTLLPGGWKRWYRWGALLALVMMFLEYPSPNPFVVLLVGETWMLHRSWVTERRIHIKNMFNRVQRKNAVTGVCFKPGPEPKKKTMDSRHPKTA